MRVFVAVVEEGSLSAAARRLRLSQPAVSQVAAALERELGMALLIRGATGVRPTPAGAVLAGEARAVLGRYEQAVAAVTREPGAAEPALRLGLPLEVRFELLAGPLAELALAGPPVRVEPRHLSTSAQLAALRAGELDLGLLRERADGDDLDALQIGAEPLGVLLPRRAAEEIAELPAKLPGGQPAKLPGELPAELPGGQPAKLPGELPAELPGELPAELPGELPAERSGELPAVRSGELPAVRLERLAGLRWLSFARSDSPAWFDEIVAVLRSHGLRATPDVAGSQALIPEVKLTSVLAGDVFSLAPADWPQPLPAGVVWLQLAGSPLVRRTWATWRADSRRRDLGRLVAALEQPSGPA
ncbi:LysR substrate binding domain-containing protein [Paractinoplanes atraurantiacus]|uniref:LysR substrate binding domain-containing protein n=2 Tax=Paractinoplanes atraurantiacus TaxID=1036182 RepID=A0A285F4J1_9ACTN|nr:LysR substrate binding domain-containing protein [Actinoplanes atraurantiacus]